MVVRLSFTQGEHQDVILTQGVLNLGSLPDNQVVLRAEGILERHASVVADPRGYVLQVYGQGARAHVNGRPVREKAILRMGDLVSIDSINILLKADSDDRIAGVAARPGEGAQAMNAETLEEQETQYRTVPPRVVLRGVSGPYFGKVIPVPGRLLIGRGTDCDLVLDEPEMSRKHALLEVFNQEIFLHDQGSANGTFVNGVQIHDARLFPGDQLAFDRNRFLIEAPGLPTRDSAAWVRTEAAQARRPQAITQTMRAIGADAVGGQTEAPAERWNPWWLVGSALLIASLVAALILLTR